MILPTDFHTFYFGHMYCIIKSEDNLKPVLREINHLLYTENLNLKQRENLEKARELCRVEIRDRAYHDKVYAGYFST